MVLRSIHKKCKLTTVRLETVRQIVEEESKEISFSLDINAQQELEDLISNQGKIHHRESKDNGLLPKHPNHKMDGTHIMKTSWENLHFIPAVKRYVCHH